MDQWQTAATNIDGLRLEAEVGRGGMGVVYRARREASGELIAVKLMLPEVSANIDFRKRFIREAQAGPMLDHPNIVPVYEAGAAGNTLYIAMRFIDGPDLKGLIAAEGALPPRRALAILRQAADALDAAHETGLVHGDVKPQNLMVEVQADVEHVFLTDFGLIRPLGSESSVSRSEAIFGSIHYVSPEQVERVQADGRADVYSLACVAYECLTARVPFDRETELAVVWAHVHEEPPRLVDHRPDLPGGLTDVVRQGMAKHPDDRYLTCGEFVDALEEGIKRKSSALVPAAIRPLIYRPEKPKTEREVWSPNYFPELSRVRKLTDKPHWGRVVAAVSALILAASGSTQILHEHGLAGAARDAAAAVAAAPERAGDLLTSITEREAANTGRDDDPQVSRRGRGREDAQERVQESDGSRLLFAPGSGPRERASATRGDEPEPEASPPSSIEEGQHIAFIRAVRVRPGYNEYDVHVANADGSSVRRIEQEGPDLDPAISPDGSRIAWAAREACSSETSCPPRRISLMRIDGSGYRQVTEGAGSPAQTRASDLIERHPDWSPSGKRIVFVRYIGEGPSDLWMLTKTGTGWKESQLTSTPGEEYDPEFSPDGSQILYELEGDLFVLDVRSLRPKRLTNTSAAEYGASWSPDGRSISYASGGVWIWPLDGRPRRLARGIADFTDWSPTGRHVAFQSCDVQFAAETCKVLGVDVTRASEPFVLVDSDTEYDGIPNWGPIR